MAAATSYMSHLSQVQQSSPLDQPLLPDLGFRGAPAGDSRKMPNSTSSLHFRPSSTDPIARGEAFAKREIQKESERRAEARNNALQSKYTNDHSADYTIQDPKRDQKNMINTTGQQTNLNEG